jgi:hypothetical protein
MTDRNPIGDNFLHWYVISVGGGYFALKSVSSGKYLDGRGSEEEPLMTDRDPKEDKYL